MPSTLGCCGCGEPAIVQCPICGPECMACYMLGDDGLDDVDHMGPYYLCGDDVLDD